MPKKKESQENSDLERYEVSLEEIDKLREEAKRSMRGHAWRQQGTQVICETCPFNHGFYIDPGMILTGIDEDGNPILEKVKYS